MRQSRINPKLSGYAILHGEFNYDAIPLAPSGTRMIVNEKIAVRGTWALHEKKAGPLVPP